MNKYIVLSGIILLILSSVVFPLLILTKKETTKTEYTTKFKPPINTACSCISWSTINNESTYNCEGFGLEYFNKCRINALKELNENLYCRACVLLQVT